MIVCDYPVAYYYIFLNVLHRFFISDFYGNFVMLVYVDMTVFVLLFCYS